MTAAEHQAKIDRLVVERQRLHADLEANRLELRDALHAQGVAAGKKP